MPLTAEVVHGGDDDALSRSWVRAVHASVRIGGVSLVDGAAIPPGPGRNYYRVIVRNEAGEKIRVLLNSAARLVAASRDADVPSNGPLDFCDVPGPEAYQRAGFRVAEVEMLLAPLTSERVSGLTNFQKRDVEYHHATVVGDVLFNWFD